VETYVDAINSGTVPCLEKAVTTLTQHENSLAVQKASDHYCNHMVQRVRLSRHSSGAAGHAHSLQEGSHCDLHGAVLQG
jgi:hypothetical protein